ncbi:SRPBCC domain-containing protein [Microbacterium sp. zg.Y909]|uniref:SRPBCC domain-containing protein n=1 Tax=Microbacterium sp. zg.Y909 TaxID=2969413 RepID=UPI00214CF932|nr:SRPBCC domain-containing protein [Microbacterium sp. zg.Y909]MCR2824276.1 SRPBCC domain-containing protein [Microbacterium sp. zg.Y909]
MTIDSPLIERHGDGYRVVYDAVYPTDIDDLWSAVTQRDRLARWMGDYRGDLRLGGTWEVADGDGESTWGRGEITACDAPYGFTTVWHAEGEEPTELVVRLEPAATGTRLVLAHTGIQSMTYGAGWQTYLERLAAVAADPDADLGGPGAWGARYAELSSGYSARFAAAI